MNDKEREEKYTGSVRFYKHVILSTVALAILIPVCACCVLLYFNFRTNRAYEKAKEQIQQMEKQLEETNQQIEETQQAIVKLKEDAAGKIEEKKTFVTSWNLLLINEANPLPQDFEVKLKKISGGQRVDERITEELNAMLSAMRAEGMNPIVCSGYRSLEKQDVLFEENIKKRVRAGLSYEEAFFKAKTRLALPGASEHHTGLAVDIVGVTHQSLNDAQANTKEAKWLAEHCEEYGFILRYPKDKIAITGRDYESWHFRYVGKEAANYIMENEITLEEYIEKIGGS